MFWCLILNYFSIFVSERCQTKKFAVVGNGSHGCMWRRNPFGEGDVARGCAKMASWKEKRHSTLTATTLKALVDFCFPEAGWCTYVRGSAFWDFGGRWGRICGPPRVEIRQFAFLEEVTFIFGGSLTSFTPGLFLSCKQKALLILRSYTRFHGSMTGDWLWLCEIPQCSRSWQVDHAVDATCGLGWAVLTFLTSGSRSGC